MANVKKTDEIYWLRQIYNMLISKTVATDSITEMTDEQLDALNVGDRVAKKTGTAEHLYTVSYKDAENGGLCLTYTDASVVETVSYDHTESGWAYNSTDKSAINGGGGGGSDTWISLLPHLTADIPEDLSTIDPENGGEPIVLYEFTSEEDYLTNEPYAYIIRGVYPAVFVNDYLLGFSSDDGWYVHRKLGGSLLVSEGSGKVILEWVGAGGGGQII